ncbi:hypothetical protein FRC03_012365 [Tulasnella sp. 419]|nr:hypothetical protein FRC03_012365 [Tulasnella sp. 419]
MRYLTILFLLLHLHRGPIFYAVFGSRLTSLPWWIWQDGSLRFIWGDSTTLRETEQPISWAFGGWGWGWAQSYLDVVDHEPIETFVSRPASFGPHITEQPGLPGYLIPINSIASHCETTSPNVPSELERENWACPPLCTDPLPRPVQFLRSENWIALVQRGNCSFVKKVKAVQSLGAKAVIVGGWKVLDGDRDDLVNMYTPDDASDITIPATYVTYASYQRLMDLIAESNTTTSGTKTISVILRAEESFAGWISPVLVFFLLLLLPSILTFITLLVHRFHQARQERLDRAPQDVVSHLPTRIWSGKGWEKEAEWLQRLKTRAQRSQEATLFTRSDEVNDGGNKSNSGNEEFQRGSEIERGEGCASPTEDDDELPGGHQPWFSGQVECAICLSDFSPGDKVRILPCGHLFHIEEVDGWLTQRKKLCPICKSDVTQPHPLSPSRQSSVHLNHQPFLPPQDPASPDATQASENNTPTAATNTPIWRRFTLRIPLFARRRVDITQDPSGVRSDPTENTPLLASSPITSH